MRIGIYGGTFDPFHKGHASILQAAWDRGKLDRLFIIPVGTAPHKSRRISFAAYRYEMVRLGTAKLDFVELRDDEIRQPGIDYTVNTVQHLKKIMAKESNAVQFFLIVGSDVLFTIASWHKPQKLLKNVRLLVALRGDAKTKEARRQADILKKNFGCKIKFFDMPPVSISSTELRHDLSHGKSIANHLPAPVKRFIASNKIYSFADEMAAIDDKTWNELVDLERKIWPLLPQKRRLHTLNVMLYSVRLAMQHHLSVRQAALASMAHDCAKHLPLRRQKKYAKRAGYLNNGNDDVIHGPAGSYYARRFLGITDRDVLAAIFYHTTSRGLMTKLDQVVYLADKIEYGRPFNNLDLIRQAAEVDLDLAMERCIDEVFKAMRRRKKDVHPFTKAARLTLTHFKLEEEREKNISTSSKKKEKTT